MSKRGWCGAGRRLRAGVGLPALAVGCILVASPAAAAPPTEQRTFIPYDIDGAPLVEVRDYRPADSCSDSFVSSQEGPLRCFSGNFIFDPCWPDPTGADRAFCVSSPDATSGVMLNDALSVHDGYPSRPNRAPWAIQLFDGSVCVFASGATSVRRGLRLNYFCGGRRVLWGAPNKRRATWTIRHSRTYSGRGWRRVKIKVAWR